MTNINLMKTRKQKVAIIGGGFTGLTAAYELSKQSDKYEITIYEKSSELGGLASGFKMHGESLEKTYHHIFKTDTDIISLVDELGLTPKLEWRDSSVCIYYDGKLYPFGGALDLLRFSPLSFFARIRQGLVILFLQKYKNWRTLVKIPAYEWMKKSAGEENLKVIWEPLLKGKFSHYFDKVSMAWLWARLHIRANSRRFGEGEKLGYFNGGFSIIVEEIKKRLLEKNVKIETNANITSITSNTDVIPSLTGNPEVDNTRLNSTLDSRPHLRQGFGGQVRGNDKDIKVRITIDENGSEQIHDYDKVICTIPSGIFAKLTEKDSHITSEYVNKLNSITYLGAICLDFSSTQNLSDFYWHNINDLNAPFLAFIHHTKLIPKERYDGKYVYYIGTYLPHDHEFFQISDEELITKWFDYLKKIFPDFDSSKIITKDLFRLRNAQHIVDLDYEQKIPDYQTPIPNVYLSNFSQIFPEDRGTNFAVRDGRKIIRQIDNSIN